MQPHGLYYFGVTTAYGALKNFLNKHLHHVRQYG
uniref:Uncharacterized protein n=1 Tax=Escherichia phage PMBT16 TaxID=3137282 RepID=A0AAU8BVJ6_9VIRU